MRPLFIPGQAGALFAVFYPPANSSAKKAILHIPAFAEEMNKSRRMVALQARAFAEQGYAVLVLDLFGTGDSGGDFGKASWQIWLQDFEAAMAWLIGQGAQSITFWGLRFGCLLAMASLSESRYSVKRLILWQPIINGETFITQFLRLRVAATMLDNNARRESTAELKQRLLDGQAVEVAGYTLNPALVKPILEFRAEQVSFQGIKETAIFEMANSEGSPLSASSLKLLKDVQKQGVKCEIQQVVGAAFWASQEITEAMELITMTSGRVAGWR